MDRVDRVRSRAYSLRRPELLATIYASAALRSADASQMLALVPSGCGLFGMSTAWELIGATATGAIATGAATAGGAATTTGADRIEVRVTAHVSGAELRCPASARGSTAGASMTRSSTEPPPPGRLDIVLVRAPSGELVIQSERPL